jgi:hypothetical protein
MERDQFAMSGTSTILCLLVPLPVEPLMSLTAISGQSTVRDEKNQ